MTAPRILLVDDHRNVIRLLHSSLDTLGHELTIIETPSGEEALLEASRHKIDLLVVDYRLPGMSGLELMEKITARHADTKVILITGLTDKKSRKEMVEAGAFAFFEKPVPLADFLDAVERGLGLQRTILPPEGDSEQVEHRKTLSGLLSRFRKDVGAQAVFLVSDRGRVLVRAGDLTDSSLEVSLLSALMAIYSAGQKVSRFIHQEIPSSFHIFRGGDQDVILVPVNAAHALFVAGERITERKKVLKVIDALLILQNEVERVLRAVGIARPFVADDEPEQPVVEEEAHIEDDVSSKELDDIFKQTKKKKLKPEEVESFWQDAVEKQGVIPLDPDKLSYEQARQLGLTPDENEA
ncbi:MAG: response regulator [Chloroflexi bacterium]|nr:response regulator [Chloroflexota bacterium]